MARPNQDTGSVRHCWQFAGDILTLVIARIALDSPCFNGEVDACAIDDTVCDVILGKISSASFTLHACSEAVAAVQTRAQTANEKRSFQPLIAAKTPQLDIGPDDVKCLQHEDDSLNALFQKAGSGEIQDDGKNCVTFELHDGVLIRHFFSLSTNHTTRLLIVPKQQQQQQR